MIRLIIPLLCCTTLLLLTTTTAHAQSNNSKQEINVGMGLFPARAVGPDNEPFEFTDDNKYYTADEKYSPSGFVQYMYHLKKWIAIGSYIGYYHYSQDMYHNPNNEFYSRCRSDHFFILPTVRFTYYHSAIVRLYSEASVGVSIYNKKDFGKTKYKIGCESTGQINFIGISVGKKLYGFTTIGIGEIGVINGGIGYRF